jgi:hypothetical protein
MLWVLLTFLPPPAQKPQAHETAAQKQDGTGNWHGPGCNGYTRVSLIGVTEKS